MRKGVEKAEKGGEELEEGNQEGEGVEGRGVSDGRSGEYALGMRAGTG